MAVHVNPRLRLVVAIAATTLTLAACGSGGTDSATTPQQPAAQAPAPVSTTVEELTAAKDKALGGLADAEAAKGNATEQAPTKDKPAAAAPADKPAVPADKPAAPAPKPVQKSAPAPSAADTLPGVSVVKVASGETVNLRSLAVAGKPTLLWFWAPHCPFCKAEAPKVLDFVAKHGNEVNVIGLGAQDDLDEAEGFLAETKTAGLQMVWDSSGKSWVHFKVTNQPTVIVLNPEGKVTKTYFREFNEAGILAAARES